MKLFPYFTRHHLITHIYARSDEKKPGWKSSERGRKSSRKTEILIIAIIRDLTKENLVGNLPNAVVNHLKIPARNFYDSHYT